MDYQKLGQYCQHEYDEELGVYATRNDRTPGVYGQGITLQE